MVVITMRWFTIEDVLYKCIEKVWEEWKETGVLRRDCTLWVGDPEILQQNSELVMELDSGYNY